MTAASSTGSPRPLREALVAYCLSRLSDGQLLERFTAERDEAAFTVLVRRHGPMVLGLCRRAVSHQQDAEDVFQATFLVLARKASSIRQGQALSSWLYAVAHRLAIRARADARRRRGREAPLPVPEPAGPSPDEPPWEARAILDEELSRLPEHYRAVILLCCMEGKSRQEAAERLGWKPGAVKIRLQRGRKLLRGRLARRGLGVPAVLLSAWLSAPATAAVPVQLAAATARAAPLFAATAGASALSPAVLSLAVGGLKFMFLSKVKLACGFLVAFTITLGSGAVMWQKVAAQEGGPLPGGKIIVQVEGNKKEPAAAPQGGPALRVQQPFQFWLREGDPAQDGKGVRVIRILDDGKIFQKQSLSDIEMFRAEDFVRQGRVPARATLSPNKTRIAIASGEKVQMFDVATGRLVWESPVPAGGNVAFAQDGKTLTLTIRLDTEKVKVQQKMALQQLEQARALASRLKAVRLKAQGDAEATAALTRLLKSEDPEVRRLAAELMQRVDKRKSKTPTSPAPGLTLRKNVLIVPRSERTDHKADLEKRLDRLMKELQELRREIGGK